MFDFEAVIDTGTYDDFKECVLAVVSLPPLLQFSFISAPIQASGRRIDARWTVELEQDLQAMYNIRAEAVLLDALRNTTSQRRRRRR